MSPHRMFIEADEWTNNRWHGSNYAPLVAWDMREGTVWDIPRTPNADAIRRLADTPKWLRGVSIPWFCDHRLSTDHIRAQCDALCAALDEIGGCDLIFTDNEEQPFDEGTLGRLRHFAARLAVHSAAVCNWNSCAGGDGWWGPYDGHVIGTHSCPQAYEMTTSADVARWMRTVRSCGLETIVHLPPCWRKTPDGFIDENDYRNTHMRARQLCRYAASRGIRRFIFAEYMIRDRAECSSMLRTISRELHGCGVLYPEDS